jgi:transcriptional regulator with XRE-family HTH domain
MENAVTGRSLKAYRNQAGISLRELGRMTGTSVAYLVSIEKGTSSPTIATLSKILRALGTDLATFFSIAASEPEKPVFSSKLMKSVSDEYREYIFLLPKRSDIRFEMVSETILAEEKCSEWEVHDCDVGGVIISGGPAELEIENVATWSLRKNDAFYIKSKQKHRLVNKGKRQLTQITVMHPPRY